MGKALPPQQGDGLVCSPSLDTASLKPPYESFLEAIAVRVPSAFYLAMSGLGTGEIMRVASACSDLWRAVEGDQAVEVRYLVRLSSVRFGSVRIWSMFLRRNFPPQLCLSWRLLSTCSSSVCYVSDRLRSSLL